MECAQLEITGGGSASPATVSFPGAYKGSDPGITINIYQDLSGYTIPGTWLYFILAYGWLNICLRPCGLLLLKY